ncbi:hypothetical protein QFZ27_004665 [Inquilinus ginsengisoli]|uniref:hypothetical protein n=1 Tax=Inquilinus ginsengisoli TaxID=363840 RepID=UPI003D1F4067
MAKASEKSNVVPLFPTVEQVQAALSKAERDQKEAFDAHVAVVDDLLAADKYDYNTPQLIEARRRMLATVATLDETRLALVRAQERAEFAAAEAQRVKDEERYHTALAMVPRFLELAEPVGFTRGANLEVLDAFNRHGNEMLRTLGRRAPDGAHANLHDLIANAAMRPLPVDDPTIKPGRARNFVDLVEQSLTWWFGINREAVQQLRDSAAAGGQ